MTRIIWQDIRNKVSLGPTSLPPPTLMPDQPCMIGPAADSCMQLMHQIALAV